jgi:hypothetical protein
VLLCLQRVDAHKDVADADKHVRPREKRARASSIIFCSSCDTSWARREISLFAAAIINKIAVVRRICYKSHCLAQALASCKAHELPALLLNLHHVQTAKSEWMQAITTRLRQFTRCTHFATLDDQSS